MTLVVLAMLCLLTVDAKARIFQAKKYGTVFGIPMFIPAEDCGLSSERVDHVASVLAEYLDSDLDGRVDNVKVHRALLDQRACVVVSCAERELEIDARKCRGGIEVWNDEIHPEGSSASRGFDATLEEVLHLVSQFGFAEAYPKIFGETTSSQVGKALRKARGGVVGAGRDEYPAGSWFTYDDRTCDNACMVTEYFYWGLTSILGGQEYPGRYDEIKREWRLNTKKKLKEGDKKLYNLLWGKRKTYRLPKRLPTGYYAKTYDGETMFERFPGIFQR